ncbi:MFS transporter [Paracidovorax konjaci]|uniref:Predicted arabinose efflux permease, MFS family n=1 Tax=Paracidovorax konjaci TaxID=32040 RepID=A0A1I1RM46_9BURK|nr:MFS transporter [Paracidovorax konjaci]SFD35222.1 Predicted arabinose efflux permease, MFS family [Paracidovorax konjaci]
MPCAHPPAAETPVPPEPSAPWAMLLALVSGFALSQAFRTVTAIIATGLQAEFGLGAQALGTFAGTFAFAFGTMQLFMGVGIDLFGVRRTVLAVFPLAVAGALLSALAPGYGAVLIGQVLIGVGCAPAFLVCTVFIARHFPARRFAFVSGVALGVGGLGMLFTGTPLAWLVERSSWRVGFGVLAGLAAGAWLLIAWRVHEPTVRADSGAPPRESVGAAMRGFGALFLLPHTLGILLLGLVTYAAFLALRGLWLGPLLIGRHGFSLVDSGNVALLVSLVSLFGPAVFGRLDPGPARRRRWILAGTLLIAAIFLAMGVLHSASADVAGAVAVGLFSGALVLQYADVRSAYPPAMTGRAMAVFTMAMFLGVALVQWATGWAAALATARGADPYATVLLTIAGLLLAGALAYRLLPAPPGSAAPPGAR